MPLAPLTSVPHSETPMSWPLGTTLPSPTKQVLSFIFGWRQGCKRSPVGAQPHCNPLQPHCRPVYCLLWAGCKQTRPRPCAHKSTTGGGAWAPCLPRGEGLGQPHSPCVVQGLLLLLQLPLQALHLHLQLNVLWSRKEVGRMLSRLPGHPSPTAHGNEAEVAWGTPVPWQGFG